MIIDWRVPSEELWREFHDFHARFGQQEPRPKGRHFRDEPRILGAWERALGHVGDPRRPYWLFFDQGEMHGEAFVYWPDPDEAFTGIVFDAEYCGRGLGAAAMVKLVEWGREMGLAAIYSSVYEDNRGALRLNLRSGFEPVGYRLVRHPHETGDLIIWKLRKELSNETEER